MNDESQGIAGRHDLENWLDAANTTLSDPSAVLEMLTRATELIDERTPIGLSAGLELIQALEALQLPDGLRSAVLHNKGIGLRRLKRLQNHPHVLDEAIAAFIQAVKCDLRQLKGDGDSEPLITNIACVSDGLLDHDVSRLSISSVESLIRRNDAIFQAALPNMTYVKLYASLAAARVNFHNSENGSRNSGNAVQGLVWARRALSRLPSESADDSSLSFVLSLNLAYPLLMAHNVGDLHRAITHGLDLLKAWDHTLTEANQQQLRFIFMTNLHASCNSLNISTTPRAYLRSRLVREWLEGIPFAEPGSMTPPELNRKLASLLATDWLGLYLSIEVASLSEVGGTSGNIGVPGSVPSTAESVSDVVGHLYTLYMDTVTPAVLIPLIAHLALKLDVNSDPPFLKGDGNAGAYAGAEEWARLYRFMFDIADQAHNDSARALENLDKIMSAPGVAIASDPALAYCAVTAFLRISSISSSHAVQFESLSRAASIAEEMPPESIRATLASQIYGECVPRMPQEGGKWAEMGERLAGLVLRALPPTNQPSESEDEAATLVVANVQYAYAGLLLMRSAEDLAKRLGESELAYANYVRDFPDGESRQGLDVNIESIRMLSLSRADLRSGAAAAKDPDEGLSLMCRRFELESSAIEARSLKMVAAAVILLTEQASDSARSEYIKTIRACANVIAERIGAGDMDFASAREVCAILSSRLVSDMVGLDPQDWGVLSFAIDDYLTAAPNHALKEAVSASGVENLTKGEVSYPLRALAERLRAIEPDRGELVLNTCLYWLATQTAANLSIRDRTVATAFSRYVLNYAIGSGVDLPQLALASYHFGNNLRLDGVEVVEAVEWLGRSISLAERLPGAETSQMQIAYTGDYFAAVLAVACRDGDPITALSAVYGIEQCMHDTTAWGPYTLIALEQFALAFAESLDQVDSIIREEVAFALSALEDSPDSSAVMLSSLAGRLAVTLGDMKLVARAAAVLEGMVEVQTTSTSQAEVAATLMLCWLSTGQVERLPSAAHALIDASRDALLTRADEDRATDPIGELLVSAGMAQLNESEWASSLEMLEADRLVALRRLRFRIDELEPLQTQAPDNFKFELSSEQLLRYVDERIDGAEHSTALAQAGFDALDWERAPRLAEIANWLAPSRETVGVPLSGWSALFQYVSPSDVVHSVGPGESLFYLVAGLTHFRIVGLFSESEIRALPAYQYRETRFVDFDRGDVLKTMMHSWESIFPEAFPVSALSHSPARLIDIGFEPELAWLAVEGFARWQQARTERVQLGGDGDNPSPAARNSELRVLPTVRLTPSFRTPTSRRLDGKAVSVMHIGDSTGSLLGSQLEAAFLRKSSGLNFRSFRGDESIDELRRGVGESSIVIASCHANAGNPELNATGLVTGEAGVSLADVASWSELGHLDFLFLGSCYASRRHVQSHERESLSLQTAALVAGCGYVAAPVNPINDLVCAVLVKEFVTRVATGEGAVLAYESAIQETRRMSHATFREQVSDLWEAFVAVGAADSLRFSRHTLRRVLDMRVEQVISSGVLNEVSFVLAG